MAAAGRWTPGTARRPTPGTAAAFSSCSRSRVRRHTNHGRAALRAAGRTQCAPTVIGRVAQTQKTPTPALSHPMGEGEYRHAFVANYAQVIPNRGMVFPLPSDGRGPGWGFFEFEQHAQ